ncbi:helix-turn-helix transcriptional regulator [bacterium]|nr:helix-turn-helix transcriptional regulator [bacterium]
MKNYAQNLANNIKKLRKINNLTIKELSQKTGINACFLIKIEQAKAKRIFISHIDAFCKCFNVGIKELFE